MRWGSVRGHEDQVRALHLAIQAGRLPHAFLFVGPEGIGKKLFAMTLAQALMCETNPELKLVPCGTCASCRQVVEGTHPDVLTVEKPEDRQELPIRSIRDLCASLGLKPMRGHRRVAIVDDADDLSDEAANAFLKTLEEPPAGSVLILIGTASELQLPTILSRCREIRFRPLSTEDLADILIDEGLSKTREDAEHLASHAEGSVSRAMGLADSVTGPFVRSMIDELANSEVFSPSRFAQRLETFTNEAGKESGPKRDRARLLIGELARFLRGVLWQTAGVESPSPDPADRSAIASFANRLEPEDVFLMADLCLEADDQVRRNANRTLVFESLSHDLGIILAGS